jgi:predicted DCC family thiol-disulfide oxidoreductase YuxK
MEEGSARLEVWFDGSCALCRRSRAWCEARDRHRRFSFRDFRAVADGELPVPRARLESAMWVRTHDGALHRGYEGWRQILAELPRWRWLARLTGLPPLRWLGPVVYGLFARRRRHLPVASLIDRGASRRHNAQER